MLEGLLNVNLLDNNSIKGLTFFKSRTPRLKTIFHFLKTQIKSWKHKSILRTINRFSKYKTGSQSTNNKAKTETINNVKPSNLLVRISKVTGPNKVKRSMTPVMKVLTFCLW